MCVQTKVCCCAKAARKEADIRGGDFGDRDKDHKRANRKKCILQHTCKATGRRELGFPGMRSTLLKLFHSLNKTFHNTQSPQLLFSQLYEAWQSGSLVDFTLNCEGLSIPCHKIVLGARSGFFRGLLRWLLSDAVAFDC